MGGAINIVTRKPENTFGVGLGLDVGNYGQSAVGHVAHQAKARTVPTGERARRRKQLQILDLFGQIDYAPDYDYKEQRRRK